MAVALTFTDTADGTGGTATISGGNAGATNTVYSAPWTGQTAAQTWTSRGSRSGNGTVSVALTTTGPYLWRVDSLTSGVTEVATCYSWITNTSVASLHDRILDAVVTRIQGLSLSGVSSANIVKRWVPQFVPEITTLPAIFVSPIGSEGEVGGLNNRDDIGFPVLVVIIAASNQNNTDYTSRNTLWRERIQSALRHQFLSGVSEVIDCVPLFGTVFDPSFWLSEDLHWSPMAFRFMTRTARG